MPWFGVCPLALCPDSFGGRLGVFVGVVLSLLCFCFWFHFQVFVLELLLGVCPGGLSFWWFSVASIDGYYDVFIQFYLYIFCH